MTRFPRPHKTVRISDSLHRQLSVYALAAGAAGVGGLVLAQPAEGKIVYTPAHVNIAPNGGLVLLDLNHDGTPDFGLSNKLRTGCGSLASLKVVQEASANEIWGKGLPCYTGYSCAAALPKGKKVGPKAQFQQDPKSGLFMVVLEHEGSWGPWLNVKQAYLGLKFLINGKTHFGWLRLKLSFERTSKTITATLTGYAYETIPNKPILTGQTRGRDEIGLKEPHAALTVPTRQPASLGMLALGAPGLAIWRREESITATD